MKATKWNQPMTFIIQVERFMFYLPKSRRMQVQKLKTTKIVYKITWVITLQTSLHLRTNTLSLTIRHQTNLVSWMLKRLLKLIRQDILRLNKGVGYPNNPKQTVVQTQGHYLVITSRSI